jgi:hypothetical protein
MAALERTRSTDLIEIEKEKAGKGVLERVIGFRQKYMFSLYSARSQS